MEPQSKETAPSGSSLRISIDRCDEAVIEGWVDDAGPLSSIDIHINGEWICSLRPDVYRQDLELAGLGDGRRAFAFPLAGRLREGDNLIAILHSGEMLVRRAICCGDPGNPYLSPELAGISQERWRGHEQPAGLTWGRLMTGDSLWDLYQRAHRFHATDHVVEFGPGYGRLLKTALERKIPFASFIGVELSPTRVCQLETEFGADPRLTFVEGDINTWSTDRKIDVVLCSSTFEHLYPDFSQAIQNFRPQLAENASLFIDFIKSDSSHRGFDVDQRTYVRFYSRDELLTLFPACGYRVRAIEECRLGIGVNGPVDRFVVVAEPA